MNELAIYNEARRQEVAKLRDAVRRRRAESPVPSFGDYPPTLLRERIARVLREHAGHMDVTWEIDFLDRVKFSADFAVRLTGLLKEYGAKEYIESHVP
jgi:arginyl-tRNA synthetase